MRKYRNYTNDDVIKYAKEVYSMAGLMRKLDLIPRGGNYDSMRRLIQKLNIDTSHWTGQGWNKNKQLKDWSSYTKAANLKKHLVFLRGNKCELCGNEIWLNKPIKLEIHHKDGDRTNNNLDNLMLLCPNCHSQTDNWRKH